MRKLAIVSVNRNKYSETFIRSHFQGLENVVAVYSDGFLPRSVSYDRAYTFQEVWKDRWWKKTTATDALKNSLRRVQPEVLLVEYGPSGVEMMHLCAELKIPMIVHFHGYDAYRDDVMENQGKHYPVMFAKAAAVVVVSQDMRDRLLSLGCPAEKIAFIPYGVDSTRFSPAEQLSHAKKVLYCGRFVAKKNPLGVLKVLAPVLERHSDATFHMIGDGPLWEEAKRFAKELACSERIVFEGVCSPSSVAERMKECSIFVQLSVKTSDNDSEGTPLALLEAMASGMLVLGTRHTGIQELIQHEKNGFLVDEHDVETTLQEVLERLPELDALRSTARQTVVGAYSLERYLGELQALINQVAI